MAELLFAECTGFISKRFLPLIVAVAMLKRFTSHNAFSKRFFTILLFGCCQSCVTTAHGISKLLNFLSLQTSPLKILTILFAAF